MEKVLKKIECLIKKELFIIQWTVKVGNNGKSANFAEQMKE